MAGCVKRRCACRRPARNKLPTPRVAFQPSLRDGNHFAGLPALKRRATIRRPYGTPADPSLLVLHCVDQLKKLGAVHDFDEGLALCLVADHVDGWGVIDADALAQIFILINSFS